VVLAVADLTLDPGRADVRRSGRSIQLTARELAVLEVLVRAEGRTVSAEQLFEKAWDDQADPMSTSVRVIVSRLRSKLGDPALIHTVVGLGYRIAAP
jgi:two-component system response regulator VanR